MKTISTIKTFQMTEIMKSKLRSLLIPSFTRKRIISPLIKTISNISHPFSSSRRKGINMSLSIFKLQQSHFPSYSYNHITIWFLSSHVSADSENSNCCYFGELAVQDGLMSHFLTTFGSFSTLKTIVATVEILLLMNDSVEECKNYGQN